MSAPLSNDTAHLTIDDGDARFTVTSAEVENAALGLLASELAWDAVLSSFAGRE